MGQPYKWPEPSWLSEITDPRDKAEAAAKFTLALAALYCTPKGNLDDLSRACNSSPSRVRVSRKLGRVTPQLAIAIEACLGRELFPRELFCPDHFVAGGE